MATPDGRRVNRPYRKASEYLATSQRGGHNGPRNTVGLENENAELRDKLTTTVQRMEAMEVEFEQSREYFSSQLEITADKLNRTTQTLKLLQRSYSELQSINYDLEQRILKVRELESEKSQLTSDVHELTNKLTDARSNLAKMQKENERLRKDCNLAVQLLQCNEGSFRQRKTNELPQELQHRVEEYQVDISQYNEYINPYSMDSEDEEPKGGDKIGNVSSDVLAKVLQKAENVHLNLEPSDYITDPELNVAYKGQIAEKKLIKYDYGPPSGQNYSGVSQAYNKDPDVSSVPRSSSEGQSSSPWEMAPTATSSGTESTGSPWEMSTDRNVQADNDDIDDYGSASAYGAYPVSYRRPKPRQVPQHSLNRESPQRESPSIKKSSSFTKTKLSASYHRVTSPKIAKPKGSGENEDVYISQTYKQDDYDADVKMGGSDGSNKSSRKSTPKLTPVGKEFGSHAEKSSLLDQEEEDMMLTVEVGSGVYDGASPKKEYRVRMGEEAKGLLGQEDSDREPDERELDHEEEKGNVREYEEESEEEGNVRESVDREVYVREPVNHDINLLNLDDNAVVNPSPQSSPAHHIMMQQLLQELESPVADAARTILPDLPPPSGFTEPLSNEILLMGSDIMVPPPPPMYVEMPLTHPQVSSQSQTSLQPSSSEVTMTSPPTVTSQMKNTTSLDDLQVFAGLEMKSTKEPSNVERVSEAQEDEDVDIRKEIQSDEENTEEQDAKIYKDEGEIQSESGDEGGASQEEEENIEDNESQEGNTAVTETNPHIPEGNTETEISENGNTENNADSAAEFKTGNGAEEITTNNEKGNITPDLEGKGNTEHGAEGTAHTDHENGNTEYGAEEYGNTENYADSAELKTGDTEHGAEETTETDNENGNTDPPAGENGNTGHGAEETTNIENENGNTEQGGDKNGNTDHGAEETTETENENGNTEQGDDKNGNTENLSPVEVMELPKEPRGGSYNRRRRNSFDQAREFGSIMDD